MIRLPKGVTINYNVKIIISGLTIEIFEWLRDVGGQVWIEEQDYNKRGTFIERPMVQFGQAKPCYYLQDGTGNVMLNFNSQDAGTALALLMKFTEQIISHNMKEAENYVY